MDDVTPDPAAAGPQPRTTGRDGIKADHARHVAMVELGRVAASLRRMQRAGSCVPDVERLLTDVDALRQRVRGEWDG